MLSIRIGGLEFVGQRPPRRDFYLVGPNQLTGWDEGTAIRRDEILRPLAHGAFDARGFLSPRVVSIAGQIVTESPRVLEEMSRNLTGLMADGQAAKLIVQTDTDARWADVRLASSTLVSVDSANPDLASFQIQFWAPDPRIYGEKRGFPGGTPAFHRGTVPALPLLQVTGVRTGGYTISCMGRSITVTANLTAGNPHTIDLASGVLKVGGQRVFRGMSVYEPWDIRAGERVTATVSNSLTLTQFVTDTWV